MCTVIYDKIKLGIIINFLLYFSELIIKPVKFTGLNQILEFIYI